MLTLALDDAAQSCFERLRQAWFPAALNVIPAHLTLFHTLPDSGETVDLLAACAAGHAPFELVVGPPKLIGRGVAYFLVSEQALSLHRTLRHAFEAELSAQDKQGFRPHVVVQNKVTPEAAKATLAALHAEVLPESVRAVGLDLWRYLGGPWEHLRRFAFEG